MFILGTCCYPLLPLPFSSFATTSSCVISTGAAIVVNVTVADARDHVTVVSPTRYIILLLEETLGSCICVGLREKISSNWPPFADISNILCC